MAHITFQCHHLNCGLLKPGYREHWILQSRKLLRNSWQIHVQLFPLPPNNDTLVITRIPDSCKVLHVSVYLVLLGASLLASGDSRDPK